MRTPPAGREIVLTLPIDGAQTKGRLTSYDSLLFTIRTDEDQAHRVLWNSIPAANVDRYWRYLESPEADSVSLMELAGLLSGHPQGKGLAEKALDQAVRLEPGLKDQAAQMRKHRPADNTPRLSAQANASMWGDLTDRQMQAGVEQLKVFCKQVNQQLELDMNLYESDRFLLLTDLEGRSVKAYGIAIEQAYRGAAVTLGDSPDDNVFVGKCLVVLFKERIDYLRFERDMHGADARGTGGLCHGFGDGHVHVAAFHRNNLRQTKHILTHEIAHAYLRRYQSPALVPDWVNEGLAEHLAHRMHPPPGQKLMLKARLSLEGKQGLGDGLFEGKNLEAWQYDVAGALAGFMIERGKHAYPKLIQKLKDGVPTDDALKEIYRMASPELTQRFKRHLDHELSNHLGG